MPSRTASADSQDHHVVAGRPATSRARSAVEPRRHSLERPADRVPDRPRSWSAHRTGRATNATIAMNPESSRFPLARANLRSARTPPRSGQEGSCCHAPHRGRPSRAPPAGSTPGEGRIRPLDLDRRPHRDHPAAERRRRRNAGTNASRGNAPRCVAPPARSVSMPRTTAPTPIGEDRLAPVPQRERHGAQRDQLEPRRPRPAPRRRRSASSHRPATIATAAAAPGRRVDVRNRHARTTPATYATTNGNAPATTPTPDRRRPTGPGTRAGTSPASATAASAVGWARAPGARTSAPAVTRPPLDARSSGRRIHGRAAAAQDVHLVGRARGRPWGTRR